MANPEVREPSEIQRAHDLLVGIISKEIPTSFADDDLPFLNAAACVLCWVLKHQHSASFAGNLAIIEQDLANFGFGLNRRPSDTVH